MQNYSPIPQPSKHNHLHIITMFVACAVICGTVGYYLGQSGKTIVVNPPKIKTAPNVGYSTDTATIDTLSNWKTFRNDTFSFKYPPEMEAKYAPDKDFVEFFYMGKKQKDSGRTQVAIFDGYKFSVTSLAKIKETTHEEVTKKTRAVFNTDYCGQNLNISETKLIQFERTIAYTYTATNCRDTNYTITVAESLDGNYYRIEQSTAGDADDMQKYKVITNDIYNTFNFTAGSNSKESLNPPTIKPKQNQVQNTPTDNWQKFETNYIKLKLPEASTITSSKCQDTYAECLNVRGHDPNMIGTPVRIKIKPYNGGSRRQEAILDPADLASYTFTDKTYGANKGLDAVFNCQNGTQCISSRSILIVVGGHLVNITDSSYKGYVNIHESPITNTIIGTISAK